MNSMHVHMRSFFSSHAFGISRKSVIPSELFLLIQMFSWWVVRNILYEYMKVPDEPAQQPSWPPLAFLGDGEDVQMSRCVWLLRHTHMLESRSETRPIRERTQEQIRQCSTGVLFYQVQKEDPSRVSKILI